MCIRDRGALVRGGVLQLYSRRATDFCLAGKRKWGWEQEVAVSVTLPQGGSVAVDFNTPLPGSGGRYLHFAAAKSNTTIRASFRKGPGYTSRVPGSLGTSTHILLPKEKALYFADDGRYELRFIKQGPRLRLESGGRCLIEAGLSPRDERAAAARPVRILVTPAAKGPKPPPGRVRGLRLGPVRPRPAPEEPD